MPISHVQSCSAHVGNSSAALTATFATNVTAGNLIVVGVSIYQSNTVTIADSLGNTYTQIGTYVDNGNNRCGLFYAENVSGGACTITATPISGSLYFGFTASEYAGALTSGSLDSSGTNTGTSATPTTGTITVSGGGSLIVGAFAAFYGISLGCSAGANSNLRGVGEASGYLNASSDIFSDISAAASLVLTSSSGYSAIGASFKPVSAGGGGGGVVKLVGGGGLVG